MIGSFVLLAALAVAGWVRHPSPAANAGPYAQPAMYAPDAQNGGAYAPSAVNAVNSDGTPCVEPVRYTTNERGVRTVSRSVQSTRAAAAPRVIRRKRSTAKSVAIVAGSAGTGAAIGALAGGGKGAGIGALAGGAAGFVYDRLTHNK